MKWKLKTSLIVSYVILILICTGLISILANWFLENQFKNYVIRNQKARVEGIVSSLSKAYEGEKKWDTAVVENIGMGAMENGMIVSLFDIAGRKLWDARLHNNGICEAMIRHMGQNMMSRYSYWKGGYMEESKNIVMDGKLTGVVRIGYYGPFFFTDNDLAFLRTLNEIILVVGIVSLLLALAVGIGIASRISKPITGVITSAKGIANKHYDKKIEIQSNILEIDELTETINELGESLQNQENLRKKLTGDVAHELRTPLTTLQSHMEAMLDGVWEPTTDRLMSCHEEVLRINRLVGDLENLSQYDRELLKLDITEFDFAELMRKTIRNFDGEAATKEITVKVEGEETIILADRDKITQVIVNLMSNALKYTAPGGKIQAKARKLAAGIEFSIIDNGIGIHEEDINLIFERFYRADKSRTRKTGGAGIGLTIVKAIVEAHGGEICVKSMLGEGSEFRVLLPEKVE